ncbi:MAG: MEDS domain-containing protein [Candidatus Binataceae bacterium]|nr:MEDS domain-containing protein [Candidatus Binataceae bacterium]
MNLHKPHPGRHFVQFYDDDSFVIDNVCGLAANALATGSSAVVVATQGHLDRIDHGLNTRGIDLSKHRNDSRFFALDAHAALSRFMCDGQPDADRFQLSIGKVISQAAESSANHFVMAFGEMVALLSAEGNYAGAIQLEQLWNAFARSHEFSLYCAYPLNCFTNDRGSDAVLDICAEHSLTIPSENQL